MKLYNVNDFKVFQKVNIPAHAQKYTGNSEYVYLVPMNKSYNNIKTDYLQKYKSDDKKALFFIEFGNISYNSYISVYDNGTWSQYRDGSFYEYVGKIAL